MEVIEPNTNVSEKHIQSIKFKLINQLTVSNILVCISVVSSILNGEIIGVSPRRSRPTTVASSLSSSKNKKQVNNCGCFI